MTPRVRVTTFSLTATIAVVLLVWTSLVPSLEDRWLQENTVLAGAVGVLSSIGLYRLLFEALAWLILKVGMLKRLFFAGYYLEGTWAGFYERADDEASYTCIVEIFEQDLDGTVIRGFSFDEHCRRKAQWRSTAVSFDGQDGSLQYSYLLHAVRDKEPKQGIGYFEALRKKANEPAEVLCGYSTNVDDGVRSPAWEIKVENTDLQPEYVLKRAIEFRKEQVSARSEAKKEMKQGD